MEVNVHFASLIVIFQAQRIITEQCNSVFDGTLIKCPVYPVDPLEPKPTVPTIRPKPAVRPKPTEKPDVKPNPPTGPTFTCEPTSWKDTCRKYLYFVKTEKYWHWIAEDECDRKDMQLVSIENSQKQADVEAGMRSIGPDDFWISGRRKGGWVWGNKCPMKYTNWDKKEPNNKQRKKLDPPGEECLQIRPNFKWNDESCVRLDHPLGFICESIECRTWTDKAVVECPTSHWGYKCKKYFYIEKERKVYQTEAKNICEEKGMDLVNIETKDKWQDLQKAIASAGKGDYWTSATKNSSGWFWGNGCRMKWNNWDSGEPNNQQRGHLNGEECIQIRPNYRWNDDPCRGHHHWGFICESRECRPKYFGSPNN